MDGLVDSSGLPQTPSATQQTEDTTEEAEEDEDFLEGEDETDEALNFGFPVRRGKISYGASAMVPGLRKSSLIDKEKYASSQRRVILSAKQEQDIAIAFESFDVAGTGYMSTVDLRVALRALGYDSSKQEMTKILNMFDVGNTGRLCFVDFMTIIERKLAENFSKEDIQIAFNMFDKDYLGIITLDNLRQVASELGEDINDEELVEMLHEADLDEDGGLDFEEFYQMLKKKSLY